MEYNSLFQPSVIGKLYEDLSKEHLIGRWLYPFEIEKAEIIVKDYDFSKWTTQIKPFEISILFYIGFIMGLTGYIELAADMIFFSYENRHANNFVIKPLKKRKKKKKIKAIDRETIIQELERLFYT